MAEPQSQAEPQAQTEQQSQAEQPSRGEILACHWHPAVSTRLWCSQCRRAICTDCMVQVPVGIRCRECGRAQPLPTYDVRPTNYILGFATALGIMIAAPILWYVVDLAIDGIAFWLGIVMPVAIGYVAGRLISRAVNLKRSSILMLVAGGTVVVSVLIGVPITTTAFDLWTLMATIAGVILAADRVRV